MPGRQSRFYRVYLWSVVISGLAVLAYAALTIRHAPGNWEWLILAALTILTGSFTIRIPALNSRISISDTFIFANLVLFGVPAGILTAALDALRASIQSRSRARRVAYALFNTSAASISALLAGSVFFFYSGGMPLRQAPPPGLKQLLIPLACMALTHYLVNSVSVATMVALELRKNTYRIWRDGFLWTSITYFAGAAAAGVIAINATSITLPVLGVIAPILVIIYFSYKTYLGKVQENMSHLEELNKLYLSTVETLAMAIDAKDQVIHGHVRRVQIFARGLARVMGVNDENALRGIEAAALLHDIGKLAIPEYILNKPGDLTASEFQKMMIHSRVGADILASINFPYPVAEYVRHHHEHWDGTGYPDGLKGTQIPLGARVLAVSDSYEALTCDRPFRIGFTPEQALQILTSRSGKQFDPEAVEKFEQILPGLMQEVRAAESQELSVVGLKAIADGVRDPGRPMPRKSRDLLVFQDISSTNREVFALYELAQTLGSTLNLHETLLIIASKMQKIVPFSTCVIYLYSAAKGRLTAEHVLGADAEQFKGHSLEFGENLSGWVAANNQAAINADPVLDLLNIRNRLTAELGNALVCPLYFERRCLGTISLYSPASVRFKDDHGRVMEIVSRQAAAAISNALKFEETQEDAFTDRLTSLPNSRYLYLYFDQEMQKAARYKYPLTLLEMDLDGLKRINDSHGHPAGDRMLVEVSRLLKSRLRGSDVVVRYAGDEFVAVMAQTAPKDAALLARRVQTTVDEYRLEVLPGRFAQVGISIGMASYPADGETLEALLTKADENMYRDKEGRKNAPPRLPVEVEPPARQLELKSPPSP